jgi:hypothetical protein
MIGEFSGAETGDPAQAQHSNSASTSEATVLLTHPTLLLASCETLFFLFQEMGGTDTAVRKIGLSAGILLVFGVAVGGAFNLSVEIF